jgi:hypothetical protein
MQISTKQLVDTTRNTILESVTNDTQAVQGIPVKVPVADAVITTPAATNDIQKAEPIPIMNVEHNKKQLDDTKTEECIEEKEPQIGKLTLKVFPYDVNDGVNSKRFRIADYRIDLNEKPYSFYDKVNNGLKNMIRFEKKEGTFYPVYNVDGNDRELWYYTGNDSTLQAYKKNKEKPNQPADKNQSTEVIELEDIQLETGVINPFEVDDSLRRGLIEGDPDIKGLELDKRNVIDSIDDKQIKRLKEGYGWERDIITIDEFAKERIMLNKNIEIDLIPQIAKQWTQGGTRKYRARQKQTSRKRNPKKLLTFYFDIVLKKKKNVPFRINRRLISSTPLKVPQKVLNKFTRKMKKPYQGHK